jgi:uncharacterized protein (DUF58 family)
MLTSRGWWLLVAILVILALALFGITDLALNRPLRMSNQPNVTAALLGLTLGLWFAAEWLLFAVRWRLLRRALRFTRELHDERGPIDTVWAKRTFRVRLVVQLASRMRIPFVRVVDLLPDGSERTAGAAQFEGALEPEKPVELGYDLRSLAIGRLRFEGLRLQLADPHGLFYGTLFVRDGVEYRVLPPLADSAGHSPSVKRHNLLPPPGMHRLRRAGTGSELLDLRDYLPGDPPKTIAWKASARRDRLITKEFESEVPLRCTLFVDASNSVRLGAPGTTALAQLVEIASSVVQAATAERDLVGLCLFDERTTSYVRPARTPEHVIALMNLLTDAAALSPYTGEARVETLQPLAHAYARRVYPELLQPDINGMPAWLPWIAPPGPSTMRHPGWRHYLLPALPLFVVIYVVLCIVFLAFAGTAYQRYLFPQRAHWDPGTIYVGYLIILALSVALVAALLRLPAHFFSEQRRAYRQRKQLAALLTVRHGLPPGALATLLEDEEFYVLQLQRFLGEHRVAYAPPLAESLGRSAFQSVLKVKVLADALLRAVSRGHDNELFVLLVNLLEVAEHLEPLLRAARVAVSRHHRVLLICPWPNEAAPRWERAFQQLRRSFARLEIAVVAAKGEDSARLILERLERLRRLGRTR